MYSYKRENRIEEEKILRLVSWANGKKQGPFKIDVEIHRRCNLRCLPCFRREPKSFDYNKDSEKYELSLKKWKGLVKQAKELGILIWNIEGGGEPFAKKDFCLSVMEETKKQGMYGIVTTNGTLLEEKDIKKIVKMGWDRIHFSIDSADSETHDYLRDVKGSFEKTIKAVILLNKYKLKYGKENPMLTLNIVISNKNYNKLNEYVELANELKADYMFVEPLMVYSESGKKLKLNKKQRDELQTYIKKAKKLAEKYKIDNNFATKDKNLDSEIVKKTSRMKSLLISDTNSFSGFLSVPCFRPWNNMTIKYNGLVGHCGLILEGDNIKDKSLKDVWYGKKMGIIREKMIKKKLLEHCSRCVPSDVTQRRRLRKELSKLIK
jgi:MoaA/NifB/PqqE/SkfB family radical SAM enzyme